VVDIPPENVIEGREGETGDGNKSRFRERNVERSDGKEGMSASSDKQFPELIQCNSR
jgi:hypothetical protein